MIFRLVFFKPPNPQKPLSFSLKKLFVLFSSVASALSVVLWDFSKEIQPLKPLSFS
jgi:hypothetical protein